MRVVIQMKVGHLLLAKKEQASEEINLRELYDYYWSSNGHKFALQSESLSELVHSYLMEKRRGRCCWNASFLSRTTILCRSYRSSFCNRPFQPANNVHIGGTSTLITP